MRGYQPCRDLACRPRVLEPVFVSQKQSWTQMVQEMLAELLKHALQRRLEWETLSGEERLLSEMTEGFGMTNPPRCHTFLQTPYHREYIEDMPRE